ncbi:hypothetical protein VPNG_08805 [Cytospora leucostoma]|uniref:BTB domain-containing protein n=1 Tax=Cytospora leucostoma TaxID=1230097 RepID=A0A423W1D9_9PEZI|nr:hypothetical protein VPNG_08805 [Cytospora leucostoma]
MDAWQRQSSDSKLDSTEANQTPASRPPAPWLPSPSSPSLPHGPGLSGRARGQMQYIEMERKHQELKVYIQALRAARIPGSDPGSVDAAFEVFARVREAAREAVRALVTSQRAGHGQSATRAGRRRHGSVQETVERLEMLRIAHGNNTTNSNPSTNNGVDGLMAAFGNMGITDTTVAGRPRSNSRGFRASAAWLATVRDWKAVVQKLLDSHRTILADFYRAYARDLTPEMVKRILDDANVRAEMIRKMRTQKAPLIINGFTIAAAYWPTCERRFRNFDTLRDAVMEVDKLLLPAETGVEEEDRVVKDYMIVTHGDAILEFANLDDSYDSPVLRFQVSSHVLAETSPIFKAVFQGKFSHPRVLDRDLRELDGQVPRGPPRHVRCPDGNEVKLYSMPQLELNKEDSLTVLLYAAHMQNDKIPREVSFAQFTAIAEACLRYQCTSPLELVVEHRWLPAWLHMAITEDQSDGLLLISFTFGLRRIFTRMTKTAVLNIVDEEELRRKSWPEKIKEKVWAVRNAKMAQVYAVCSGAIQEYFRPPTGQGIDVHEPPSGQSGATLPPSALMRALGSRQTLQSDEPSPPSYNPLGLLTSTPRCPKGSHWCDATNLGWLLIVLNELQLLWTVISPAALPQEQETSPHARAALSLIQLMDALRSIPSPPQAVHPGGSGVCDPAPAFRAAVNDVYNSITGLTLFEVDGKRHGWALSERSANDPHNTLEVPLRMFGRMTLEDEKVTPVTGVDECMVEGPYTTVEARKSRSDDVTLDNGAVDDKNNNNGNRIYHPSVTLSFTPGEAICLRIMSSADDFDDLHALALTSRTFYTAFKQNELTLMRHLVRANRRLTLKSLLADSDRLSPPKTAGLGDGDKVLLRVKGDISTQEKSSEALSQSTVEERYTVGKQLHLDDNTASGEVSPSSWGPEEVVDRHSMTEEEAHRIIWPDEPFSPQHGKPQGVATEQVLPEARDDSGEKFLAGDIMIVQAAEEKALVVLGDKNLRGELDWRRGITSE